MDPDYIPRPLDLLLGYTPGMKLPSGTQWHPEDAIKRLRNTEDRHYYWLAMNRMQVQWKKLARRITRVELSETSLANGRRIVRQLIERGLLDMGEVNETDVARAEEAMAFAVGLVKDGTAETKHRLNAANLVLTFCRSKPVAKQEVTVKSAEDWLDEVLTESGEV